jgi:chemotaxis protein histidine kinase CheA
LLPVNLRVLTILRKINSNKWFKYSKSAEICLDTIEKDLMAYELELFAKDAKSGKIKEGYNFRNQHTAWVCLEDGSGLLKGRALPLPSQVKASNSEEKKEEAKKQKEEREVRREEKELEKQQAYAEKEQRIRDAEALRVQREERRLKMEEEKIQAAKRKEKQQQIQQQKREEREDAKEKREAAKEKREQARFEMEKERMQHQRQLNNRYKLMDKKVLDDRQNEYDEKKYHLPEDQRKKAQEAVKFQKKLYDTRWNMPGTGPKWGKKWKNKPKTRQKRPYPDSRYGQPQGICNDEEYSYSYSQKYQNDDYTEYYDTQY